MKTARLRLAKGMRRTNNNSNTEKQAVFNELHADKTNVLRDANIFRQIKFWWFFNKWQWLPEPVRTSNAAFVGLCEEKISFVGKFIKFRCANKYDGVPFNRITNWCTRTTVSYIHQNIRGHTNGNGITNHWRRSLYMCILDGRQAFLCITKRRTMDRLKITKHHFSRRVK